MLTARGNTFDGLNSVDVAFENTVDTGKGGKWRIYVDVALGQGWQVANICECGTGASVEVAFEHTVDINASVVVAF